MKSSNQLGKNIRALRKAFGETQEELAFSIGKQSLSTISNYEKGERYPEPETISRIAQHYRITEDELASSDFSQMKKVLPLLQDKVNLKNMFKVMHPISISDDALTDSNFKKAYDSHRRLFDALYNETYPANDEFDICIDNYEVCSERNIPEAIANLLAILIMLQMVMKNERLFMELESYQKDHIDLEKVIKNGYLKNFDFDDSYDSENSDNSNDTEELEQVVIELMKKLNNYNEYSELVSFFSGLRYSFSLVNSGLSDEMNQTVGREMLLESLRLGNKYAFNFFRVVVHK